MTSNAERQRLWRLRRQEKLRNAEKLQDEVRNEERTQEWYVGVFEEWLASDEPGVRAWLKARFAPQPRSIVSRIMGVPLSKEQQASKKARDR